jgi:hypothetical protein
MLFVPMAVRMSFWAMKFISFVAFEHEKPCVGTAVGHRSAEAIGGPLQRLVP